jgi:hypothetical protein
MVKAAGTSAKERRALLWLLLDSFYQGHTLKVPIGATRVTLLSPTTYLLLLLLTHGLVSFKLLYGLCRYALSAFVPPSVIPNLQKNSWCGQAIKQICE